MLQSPTIAHMLLLHLQARASGNQPRSLGVHYLYRSFLLTVDTAEPPYRHVTVFALQTSPEKSIRAFPRQDALWNEERCYCLARWKHNTELSAGRKAPPCIQKLSHQHPKLLE